MGSANLILAALFGLTGLVILVYLLVLVGRSILNNLKGIKIRNLISKKESEIGRAEVMIQVGNTHEAVEVLKTCFLMETIAADHGQIDKIFAHNLSVLSVVNKMSRDYSQLYRNVPVVQELLQARRNLMRTLLDTKVSKNSLAQKRMLAVKSPSWALTEFDKKISEISAMLKTNTQSLNSEIDRLFSALYPPEEKTEATYH